MKHMTKNRNGTGTQAAADPGRDMPRRTPPAPTGVQQRPSSVAAAPDTRVESKAFAPSREEIARRAYELYLSRNGSPGSAEDDWVQAERELSGRSFRSAARGA